MLIALFTIKQRPAPASKSWGQRSSTYLIS